MIEIILIVPLQDQITNRNPLKFDKYYDGHKIWQAQRIVCIDSQNYRAYSAQNEQIPVSL